MRSDYDIRGAGIRAVHLTVLGHHAMTAVVGLAGFLFTHSPSLTIAGGLPAAVVFSGALLGLGLLAFFARLAHRIAPEMIVLIAIAAIRILWGGLVVHATATASDGNRWNNIQIGLSMMAGGVFIGAWAAYAIIYVRTGRVAIALEQDRAHILNSLAQTITEVTDQHRER